MKLGPSRGSTVVPALVAALVLLGVSVALAGRPTRGERPEPSDRPTPPAASATPTVAPTRTRPPDASRDGWTRGRATPSAGLEADASCRAALGTGETGLARGRGLARAIARVSENCERNPQAAGLPRALGRLGREGAQEPRGRGPEAGRSRAREPGHARAAGERGESGARSGPRAEPSGPDGHPTPGGPGRARR